MKGSLYKYVYTNIIYAGNICLSHYILIPLWVFIFIFIYIYIGNRQFQIENNNQLYKKSQRDRLLSNSIDFFIFYFLFL